MPLTTPFPLSLHARAAGHRARSFWSQAAEFGAIRAYSSRCARTCAARRARPSSRRTRASWRFYPLFEMANIEQRAPKVCPARLSHPQHPQHPRPHPLGGPPAAQPAIPPTARVLPLDPTRSDRPESTCSLRVLHSASRRPCARSPWSQRTFLGAIVSYSSSCARWCAARGARPSSRRARRRRARSPTLGMAAAGASTGPRDATVRSVGCLERY